MAPKKNPKKTDAPVLDQAEVVAETAPESTEAAAPQFKKPDLIDQVVARSSVKKRDAKPALEAALALIGEALARGDELVLPPLGKIRMIKSKDLGGGAQAMTLKLRTMKDVVKDPSKDAVESDETALATDGEDD
ncbi:MULTISPECIES: HU family DNA-binding protein [unclassified Yoonia]|uniref:HU family DNA-binding protein n=1 Tax=unclassified Yoonia TaxID=2629118 RepID=UPI002AFF6E7A|nr:MULTISPECIES: HU family DNA-binding protein [unclassified Yoonia]